MLNARLKKNKKIFKNVYKLRKRFIYKHLNKNKQEYNILKKFGFLKKIFCLFMIFFLYFSITKKRKNKITNFVDKKTKSETKICICVLAKQENLYIREYLNHYKNYGINKVYLYDNNDIDGEKFEDAIDDFIKSGFVELSNWRGKLHIQLQILNECYKIHKDNYDWIMFSEIDEFIHLYNNYSTVQSFLDEPKFNNCSAVYLNLVCHTDNEQLHYENKSVKERFPNIVPTSMIGGRRLEIKYILRGHLNNLRINCVHRGMIGIKNNCNGFGHYDKYNSIYTTEPDTAYYYYDHYYSKSTEEFIKKVKRGDGTYTEKQFKLGRIKKYFEENTLTMEKILMIENGTGFDLSGYKRKINLKF